MKLIIIVICHINYYTIKVLPYIVFRFYRLLIPTCTHPSVGRSDYRLCGMFCWLTRVPLNSGTPLWSLKHMYVHKITKLRKRLQTLLGWNSNSVYKEFPCDLSSDIPWLMNFILLMPVFWIIIVNLHITCWEFPVLSFIWD